jgi:hypothetical protein
MGTLCDFSIGRRVSGGMVDRVILSRRRRQDEKCRPERLIGVLHTRPRNTRIVPYTECSYRLTVNVYGAVVVVRLNPYAEQFVISFESERAFQRSVDVTAMTAKRGGATSRFLPGRCAKTYTVSFVVNSRCVRTLWTQPYHHAWSVGLVVNACVVTRPRYGAYANERASSKTPLVRQFNRWPIDHMRNRSFAFDITSEYDKVLSPSSRSPGNVDATPLRVPRDGQRFWTINAQRSETGTIVAQRFHCGVPLQPCARTI